MDGYLSKPIDPLMLFAVVERDTDGGPQTAVVEPITFDAAAMQNRLGDDSELMADVIRVFLEDLPIRLAEIGDAVTHRNAANLGAAAHSLKGAASNLSLGGLFEAARVLERIGAESRMNAAEAAWRQLSVEASNVIDVLSRHTQQMNRRVGHFRCAHPRTSAAEKRCDVVRSKARRPGREVQRVNIDPSLTVSLRRSYTFRLQHPLTPSTRAEVSCSVAGA